MMELNRQTDGERFDAISKMLLIALTDLLNIGAINNRAELSAIIGEHLPPLLSVKDQEQNLINADEALKKQMIEVYDNLEKQALQIQKDREKLKAEETRLAKILLDKLAAYQDEI